MLDTLPREGSWVDEQGVVNLDSVRGEGSHWVAYSKRGRLVSYFDSFGNLEPPPELIKYWKKSSIIPLVIEYNYKRRQPFNSVQCGALCLAFLTARKRK